jgi:hypothetical protein
MAGGLWEGRYKSSPISTDDRGKNKFSFTPLLADTNVSLYFKYVLT